MTNEHCLKAPIDFEKIKKQKKSYESDIRVHKEWLITHPERRDSKRIIAEAYEKIIKLDDILLKEPPIPELPPGQPLIKVSGVLEEIEIQFVRGYFSDREYAPEEFS